ncbi:MAG: mandelate racemase/muconate lactonizing enzyme family protein [Rhodospirillales bacterium]
MNITDLTTHLFSHQPENPPRNARTVWKTKHVLLVRIETDTGLFGVGEAWVDGADPSAVEAILLKDVRPYLLGRDPFMTDAVFDALFDTTVVSGKRGIMHAAASAVDIALWDIKGKAANLPIYRMIGGNSSDIFTYASGGLYQDGKGICELANEMAGYVAQGFAAVKIKVGGVSVREDIDRVAAVRAAIGPDIMLMADALYNHTVPDAMRFARAVEEYDLAFYEAPVTSYDIEGLARVAAVAPMPIAGNEIEFGRHAYRRLIEAKAVGVVHIDAILCGGISESLKIAAVASAHNLPVSMHNSSSVIAFAANLQVAAAIGNHHSTEYHMVHRLLFDHVEPGVFARDGSYVIVSERPGLGLEFDPSDLD